MSFVVFVLSAALFFVTATFEVRGQETGNDSPQIEGGSAVDAATRVDFAHDILPVLKSKCAKCHTAGVYKGGLSLESREKLLESGAVVVELS